MARPNATACEHTDRPHKAHGLCASCYQRRVPEQRAKANARSAETRKRRYAREPEIMLAENRAHYRANAEAIRTKHREARQIKKHAQKAHS